MSDRTCLSCGYCLDHLARDVCPECGEGFDPADPATYREVVQVSVGWAIVASLATVVLAILLWVVLLNALNSALCWWWNVPHLSSDGWPFSRTTYPSVPHPIGQVLLAAQVYVLAAWALVASMCLRRAVARRLARCKPSWPRI